MTDTKGADEWRDAALTDRFGDAVWTRADPDDGRVDEVAVDDEVPVDASIAIADPAIGTAERRNVLSVLESKDLANGEVVSTFERAFAERCGADHGVATANGTAALHAALHAAGIGDGDRVLTTPFSFVATANAIRLAGGTPVFADIDPASFNLAPSAVKRRMEELDGDVAAILAVHLFGLPAPMAELREIAEEYDASLIEDAAQAHGARYRGDPVGSLGDLACFSFYPTKNMTTGEGGMVLTDRPNVERRLRRFVNHGRDPAAPAIHRDTGHNFRMTNIAAAMGHVQLDRLDEFVEQRRRNAGILSDRLAETPVETPVEPDGHTHAFNQFTIRSEERDQLRSHLADFGIDTGLYYRSTITDQPAYHDVDVGFERAERAADQVLSLPVHPGLSTRDVNTVATAIQHFFDYD